MSRALLAVLALLVLSGPAAAQFVVRTPGSMSMPAMEMVAGNQIVVEFRTDQPSKTHPFPQAFPWLVAGYDNVVNLTVLNQVDKPLNATFRLNVTGATTSADEIVVSVPAYGFVGTTFVVHPADVGTVLIEAEASDAFQPGGDPLRGRLELPALRLPSATFIDPPVPPPPSEDDEFTRVDSYGPPRSEGSARIRIPPGASVFPRVELHNPFDAQIAGFTLNFVGAGSQLPSVQVAPLDPGERRVIELPEYRPMEAPQGRFFGGMMGSFEVRPIMEVDLGGAKLNAGTMSYALDRGAVVDVRASYLTVDVQNGLAIDLFVPKNPVLGAPTRVKYNFTNLETTPAVGLLTITLMPPNGLYYEVQGPETHQVPISLAGGERGSGAIPFTPRVTGSWVASTFFRSDENYGTGSGGGFEVPGPVVIAFEETEQVFARIGQPLDVGVVVSTTQPLQDAQLRVASGGQYYRSRDEGSGGAFRAGFAQDLIRGEAASSLGTLRPGGAVNTSLQVVARSSGSYTIVPYVLAEGFAYTSTIQRDPVTSMPIDPGFQSMSSALHVQVPPRVIPAGLSLAPLALGLVFFVGVWTFRTRFVK